MENNEEFFQVFKQLVDLTFDSAVFLTYVKYMFAASFIMHISTAIYLYRSYKKISKRRK